MAEFTLLQMTQNILSALSSDEVNSISDTSESMQIAQIIQNKYYDIAARGDLPEHFQLFQLNPSNDPTSPTLMYAPAGVYGIDWIKYFNSDIDEGSQTDQFGAFSKHDVNTDLQNNAGQLITTSTSTNTIALGSVTFVVPASLSISIGNVFLCQATTGNAMSGTVTNYSGTSLVLSVTSIQGSGTFSSWTLTQTSGGTAAPGYEYVTILGITQFLDMVQRFDITQNNVKTFTLNDISDSYPSSFTFNYTSDHQPRWCCILSNYYVIFDSFDSELDSTLQASKTMCYGQVIPPFILKDTFVPTLQDQQFPLLLNESKALAFYELKQQPHAKAEQEIKRQWAVVQRSKSLAQKPSYFNQLPNFGRVIGSGGYAVGYPYGYPHSQYI